MPCVLRKIMACVKLSINSYHTDQAKLSELKSGFNATELFLSGPLSDEDIGLVCKEVLIQLESLEKITLELRECTDNGCVHITNLIENNSSIQCLSLRLNNVGEKGAQILAKGLLKSSLQSFSMYAAQLDLHDQCIGDTGTKYIADALKDHPTLKSLYLAQNRLSNVGLAHIIENLCYSSVCELDLRSNNIDSEGAKVISSYLVENNTLKKLVLNENRGIQNEGAKEIALSLTTNSSLTQLSLRSCGIGKKGAERFAACLAQNTTLQTLDLCGNTEVGDDAVELMSRGLKENRSLLELNLSCCGLGDEGCAHLAEALLVNGTLTHLWLQKNEIGDGGILSLSETIRQNKLVCILIAQ